MARSKDVSAAGGMGSPEVSDERWAWRDFKADPTVETAPVEVEERTRDGVVAPLEWQQQQKMLAAAALFTDDALGFIPPWDEAALTDRGSYTTTSDRRPLNALRYVGGLDISFVKGTTTAVAALVVLEYPSLNVIHEVKEHCTMDVPYIPGFLAFREVDPLRSVVETARKRWPQHFPQVFFVDGCGLLHYRKCGLATHLGVMIDVPTVGCAKNLLVFAAKRGHSAAVPIGKGSAGRIRMTNRANDARQFSTVRTPRRSEIDSTGGAARTLPPELRAGEAGRKAAAQQQRARAAAKSGAGAEQTSSIANVESRRATSTFEGLGAASESTDTSTKRRAAVVTGTSGAATGSSGPPSAAAFDPIPADSCFSIVTESQYWPPLPLTPAELALAGGSAAAAAGGLDQYDRRDDEALARRQKMKAMAGEVRHPRGRGPANSKISFDDADDDDSTAH